MQPDNKLAAPTQIISKIKYKKNCAESLQTNFFIVQLKQNIMSLVDELAICLNETNPGMELQKIICDFLPISDASSDNPKFSLFKINEMISVSK